MTEEYYIEKLAEKNEELMKTDKMLIERLHELINTKYEIMVYADWIGEILMLLQDNTNDIPVEVLSKISRMTKKNQDKLAKIREEGVPTDESET